MQISVEERVFSAYPRAQIGYLVAHVEVAPHHPFVEEVKASLSAKLAEWGIHVTNFAAHPSIAIWREIYQNDFGVKAKTYRSSIEALVRRVLTGKALWQISSVVDLYNSCSILSLLPMGGYDLDRISGDIAVRYAQQGETFLGLGEKTAVPIDPCHVVYADESDVLCWLWNYRDAAKTAIRPATKRVIFFVDAAEGEGTQEALALLQEMLREIGGIPLTEGILQHNNLSAMLEV